MVGRVTWRKNCAQGGTLGCNLRTMIDRRNRRASGVVRTGCWPGLLHNLHTAEHAGHILDPADMVLVRMGEDDALQFIGVGEFAQATWEIFSPFWNPDTGVQQKRATSCPDNIGIGAGTGERTGIMPKYSRNPWRQPGVIG